MSGKSMQKYEVENKWIASLAVALIFIIVGSPLTYHYTNKAAKMISYRLALLSPAGVPNMLGLGMHALVAGLLARAIMM